MNAQSARIAVLVFALTALAASGPVRAVPSPDPHAGNPPARQTQPPAKGKKPAEPIDPDTSAGVRGPGSPLTIIVRLRQKAVEGAQVIVRNTNGTLAASCTTGSWGDCKVEVGADNYQITATTKKLAGSVSVGVTDSTAQVEVQMARLKN